MRSDATGSADKANARRTRTLWLAAGAASAALLAFLGANAWPVDAQARLAHRDGLHQLAALHAQLDLDLLAIRQNLPVAEDALETNWRRMREIEDRLFTVDEPIGARLATFDTAAQAGHDRLLAYYSYKNAREARIGQFVDMNRAMDAATSLALHELDTLAAGDSERAAEALALRTAFLYYLHAPTEAAAGLVHVALTDLAPGSAAGTDRDIVAANNVEYVLRQIPRVDALLLDLLNESPRPLLDMLADRAALELGQSRREEAHHIALLALAALLLLGALALAMRLRESRIALESSVDARARKLAEVYEELKQSQLQMMQSEKMASLGQMVAGLAHEINTPLGYSRSNVDLMQELLAEQADTLAEATGWPGTGAANEDAAANLARVRQLLEEGRIEELADLLGATRQGLDQISELVDGLRSFSRLDRSRVDRVDLNRGVEDVLRIARNTLLKHSANVHRQLGDLPLVSCVPSQINQVLLNLVVNAAQALPEGGGNIAIETRVSGRCVEILVEDDGCGMPPEVAARIFDPFYTTKEIGKGTGLGLSIAYQIMHEHGGAIGVESTPGEGTRFVISLPLSE